MSHLADVRQGRNSLRAGLVHIPPRKLDVSVSVRWQVGKLRRAIGARPPDLIFGLAGAGDTNLLNNIILSEVICLVIVR